MRCGAKKNFDTGKRRAVGEGSAAGAPVPRGGGRQHEADSRQHRLLHGAGASWQG